MKFFIETFGCQMNEHDSEKMAHLLRVNGHTQTDQIKESDIIIVNTCSVRQKAEQKFFSLMGRLKKIKDARGVIIGVTGCIAQQEKEVLKDRLPYIDFILGTSTIHKIKDAIEYGEKGSFFCDVTENGCSPSLFIKPWCIENRIKAYVTIMKGCNNFCSYCIVPYVRGREISRPSKDIIEEVKSLAQEGVKEITLLGQNVNSYNKGTDDISFPALLRALNKIDGIERIRFVTSHPKDLSDELIDCFGELNKLCEHIHLPFQSGSDKILKLMNRGYTISEYVEKVERLKKVCSEIAITADCIVGFPGEEEEDFKETLNLITHIEFDGIFSFAYSKRKYTKAALFLEEVSRDVALERLKYLQSVQKQITLKKNKAMEGRILEVLVEGKSKGSKDDLTGRTRHNRIVNFKGGDDMIGRLVDVKIIKGYANSLRGEWI
ncbi:MAG TPA: tRNA (N6-isopentenyl adenosine(37)-C2)-methylthiotransferase MiaB [Syntrophorhabdaceae bacterium]|nr:tRNA (N6-isopentenyl adenosine(37)-C2)-methylthiotransferase MiaB [Syntrophorhabdaceae bacterium]